MESSTGFNILADPQELAAFQQKLLQKAREPSSLPQSLIKVLNLIKDPKASVHDLSEIITRDPSLTIKILKVSNSARYGTRCQVSTIPQAVMILGMKAVGALALSTGIYDLTRQWEISIDRNRFWRHSLQVAIASRLIAEQTGHADPDEVFVSGLVHDIGVLFMESACPDEFRSIWNQIESKDRLPETELINYKALHADVGGSTLRNWNFPSDIAMSVSEHHNVDICNDMDPATQHVRIVALANLVSPYPTARSQQALPDDSANRQALRAGLHIQPVALRQIVKMLLAQILLEAEFLEIDLGSYDEYLQDANEIIYRQYTGALKSLKKRKDRKLKGIKPSELNSILKKAETELEQQYNVVCDLLATDWLIQEKAILSRQNENLPNSTPAAHIICNQYIAMENVLRDCGLKV
ncbi:MAG: HDOD domain-containing protein [Planctomycetota bacterium]